MYKKITVNELVRDKPLDEAFKEFIQYYKAKNLTRRSIDYYEYNYKRFKEFLEVKGIVNINNIDQRVVQQFTLDLRRKIEKGTSINGILRAVRALLY
ncbi:MAG: site-specific integrase [bacterium]